jgi:hypothetical protein
MENQLISYGIFLFFSFFITIKLGWVFYKNGEIYLHELFNNQEDYVRSINKLLLIGYYLVNLGKASITIAYWETITTIPDLIRVVGLKLGSLLLLLAIMHYVNVIGLALYSKNQQLINN